MSGVKFAFDVGLARIGVARCDAAGILAIPVETVRYATDGSHIDYVVSLLSNWDVTELIVGLPKHLNGTEGQSAAMAREFGEQLSSCMPDIPVRYIDERLTTVSAHQQLTEVGKKRREHRQTVDQVAAVLILEQALDMDRRACLALDGDKLT